MRSDNNIERKGKEIDKKKLADLEKIEFDVEQDLLRTLKEMYENGELTKLFESKGINFKNKN